jgi:hypothetical protein
VRRYDLQDLRHCSLLSLALVPLSLRLRELAPEIGDDLLRIGEGAVRRRAHLRTSSGRLPRADHMLMSAGRDRTFRVGGTPLA